jgi:hypothetical protein
VRERDDTRVVFFFADERAVVFAGRLALLFAVTVREEALRAVSFEAVAEADLPVVGRVVFLVAEKIGKPRHRITNSAACVRTRSSPNREVG